MLKDKLIRKALSNADLQITIDRSRCMRMRLDQNSCPVCISNCHSGAITIDDEIVIDADRCSLCMVCVSECPTDCLDIKGSDFFSLLGRLRKVGHSVPSPVIGCNLASGTDAHERIPCLGSLSEEHLLAIQAFMDKPLQLNLTSCAGCPNSFVIDLLRERVTGIRDALGIDVSEKAVLIDHKADLRFEAVSYDRRGFFSAVKNMAFIGASGLFENNEGATIQSYSEKRLPLKRDILNKVLNENDNKELSAKILQGYAFSVKADAACDNCHACVGICPTGALKSRRDDTGTALLFNSSICIGCGLCRDFCLNNSIVIQHGYSGENYFEYETCNNDLCRPNAADAVCCLPRNLHAINTILW